MDLRQLQYVVEVARTLNFTRAANQLHVAQPALSKAIANLEAELGTRLFDRTSRRVVLTDAGAIFVARSRRILADIGSLAFEMQEFGQGLRGTVRMSTWFHLEPLLPDFLRAFLAENPRIDISIVELPAPEMLDALRRNEIDIGVGAFGADWDLTEIAHEFGRTESLMLVVPAGDPLAGRSHVRIEDARDRLFIAPRSGTSMRTAFDRMFAVAGIEPQIIVDTNEVAAAIAYVGAGLGLSVLPESVVAAVLGETAMVPLAGVPPVQMALAWHDGGYRTPAAEKALTFVRTAVAGSVARKA